MHNSSTDQSCCTPTRSDDVPVQCIPDRFPKSSSSKIGDAADNAQLISLPGGEFLMGTDNRRFPADGEGPIRTVTVDAFDISSVPVTNADFDSFVSATGHVTDAERFGWSFVFKDFVSQDVEKRVSQVVQGSEWWWRVDGADWRHPDGPDSCIEDRSEHPVTHVSWSDAFAYCEWADVRLPTEAEWEYAARGGLQQASYAWGDELEPAGKHMCNIWQGTFPQINTLEDGHHGTSPVQNFEPNDFGLYDVAGNVWEWCSDWWSVSFHRNARRITRENPQGPRNGNGKVIRGGSYLCHDSYCNRYRVGARTSNTPDSSTGNLGFRVAAQT